MNPPGEDEQTWVLLRERSLQPGGFGEDRATIWPALLGAQPLSDPPPYSEVDGMHEYVDSPEEGTEESITDPHPDERQIRLDTDRSFVLYPGESDAALARDKLRNDLHGLLVSLFRKRRSLHYFQGFHDIITVIFLTLPRQLHYACAEKMALHRVRDAMGIGLEPILGLLRVLRNLLRLADLVYANLLESTSPLPYHALSNLLTLFSHDVPTLPLIQHVWDFLLSREPIAVVWLAAALILHRKPSIFLLAERDEEGMIHSLLGRMPELVDAEPEFLEAGDNDFARGKVDPVPNIESASGMPVAGPDPYKRLCSQASDRTLLLPGIDDQTCVSQEGAIANEGELEQNAIPSQLASPRNDTLLGGLSHTSTKPIPSEEGKIIHDFVGNRPDATLKFACSIPLPNSRSGSPVPSSKHSPVQSPISSPQEAGPADRYHSSSSASVHSPSHLRSSSFTPTPTQSPTVANGSSSHLGFAQRKSRSKPAPLSLTHLLRQADDLLTNFPPSHPSLRVTEIMGVDSAMRTWRPLPISTIPEKQPHSETDDYLETLVKSPHIVIPSPPPSPLLGPRYLAKNTRASPKALSKALLDPRRISLRLGAVTPAERRLLFIGALLVVGAAVALKSTKGSCVDGTMKASGGDGLKRLWNGKWTLISTVVAAWGRGLP